ncbi:MAG: phosphoglucosamine mutase [Trueperaceae bacterium]
MSARRYFGTDGIRGVAGANPMTATFALELGAATADHLHQRNGSRPTVVVGRDTRRSGPMLVAAMTAGLTSRGADVVDLGVMPTPGVSHMVRALGAQAGVVVSASHNPFDDNGLKLFGPDGAKLTDEEEAELELRLEAGGDGAPPRTGAELGRASRYRSEDGHYVRFLLQQAPYLDGLRVGLDCAHGAAYALAPAVFQRIGARLDVINAKPDGTNINAECGSTHPQALSERVVAAGLDAGVTFDGDADRALLVDRRGRLVSGDHILAICAIARGERTVVATHMTNLGTERYLAERGIALRRVAVGDRYVLEGLRAEGLTLGGEQSGHVLFLDKAPTGDGILTALQVLAACRASDRPLETWVDEIPVFPQRLVSLRVPVAAKDGLADDPEVAAAIAAATADLGDEGRVLVRASGTEPLLRVMVEAATQEAVDRWTERLAAAIKGAAERVAVRGAVPGTDAAAPSVAP